MIAQEEFQRFFDTIKALRAPNGCPWDKEQTPLSMRNDLIEESFEALDAISEQNPEHAKEELGDVILNATMISYMYEQENHFTVADVYKELTDKLIRRHPHVFPESEGQSCVEQKTSTPEEVLQQWDRIKSNLENRKSSSILDEVPNGFPPLLKAYKMQKKAAKKGFDWKDLKPVKDKIFEELNEVEQAYETLQQFKQEPSNTKPFTVNSSETANELQLHLEEEIGDLLFSVVNYARHLNVDPSVALNRTNQKFYKRFSYVEQEMTKANIPMDYEHLKEQDNFWKQAKDILTSNTLYVSKKNDKYGFVNEKNEVVVDYIYDDATEQNSYGYAAIKKDGLWGAIDSKGNIVIEPKYNLDDNLVIDFIGKWHLGEDLNMNYYCDI